MFDGIKIQDVAVGVDALLTNDRLTFGALVDGQTGVILNPVRKAYDRGLTFRLVPRKIGRSYRVEVKGSLHKFHNNGQHNADQFTINKLLLTLNELASSYDFDLFKSKINNVEFGVNVELPFPVSQVLKNLVCYKNQPFYLDTNSDTPYYVCMLQRYAIKIYDKGKQKGLKCNLLRFEIRVRKMEYFNDTDIRLRTLSDLSNVANYQSLGALLVDTFNEILFDDPMINLADLTPYEQEIYRNGRNPRFWQKPNNITPKQANAQRQRMSRDRRRYRALFDQYGGHWQREAIVLIRQTWDQLTTVDEHLLYCINEYRSLWKSPTKLNNLSESLESTPITPNTQPSDETCHKLTATPPLDLSQINPLYSRLHCDRKQLYNSTLEQTNQPQQTGAIICPITGLMIEYPRPRQRFISATQLKNLYHTDCHTFNRVAAQFLTLKQAGANLNQQCYYMAHNIRNAYTNQFNNPLRRLKKYLHGQQIPLLFTLSKDQLTDRIQAGIEYREGTRYEVDLSSNYQ